MSLAKLSRQSTVARREVLRRRKPSWPSWKYRYCKAATQPSGRAAISSFNGDGVDNDGEENDSFFSSCEDAVIVSANGTTTSNSSSGTSNWNRNSSLNPNCSGGSSATSTSYTNYYSHGYHRGNYLYTSRPYFLLPSRSAELHNGLPKPIIFQLVRMALMSQRWRHGSTCHDIMAFMGREYKMDDTPQFRCFVSRCLREFVERGRLRQLRRGLYCLSYAEMRAFRPLRSLSKIFPPEEIGRRRSAVLSYLEKLQQKTEDERDEDATEGRGRRRKREDEEREEEKGGGGGVAATQFSELKVSKMNKAEKVSKDVKSKIKRESSTREQIGRHEEDVFVGDREKTKKEEKEKRSSSFMAVPFALSWSSSWSVAVPQSPENCIGYLTANKRVRTEIQRGENRWSFVSYPPSLARSPTRNSIRNVSPLCENSRGRSRSSTTFSGATAASIAGGREGKMGKELSRNLEGRKSYMKVQKNIKLPDKKSKKEMLPRLMASVVGMVMIKKVKKLPVKGLKSQNNSGTGGDMKTDRRKEKRRAEIGKKTNTARKYSRLGKRGGGVETLALVPLKSPDKKTGEKQIDLKMNIAMGRKHKNVTTNKKKLVTAGETRKIKEEGRREQPKSMAMSIERSKTKAVELKQKQKKKMDDINHRLKLEKTGTKYRTKGGTSLRSAIKTSFGKDKKLVSLKSSKNGVGIGKMAKKKKTAAATIKKESFKRGKANGIGSKEEQSKKKGGGRITVGTSHTKKRCLWNDKCKLTLVQNLDEFGSSSSSPFDSYSLSEANDSKSSHRDNHHYHLQVGSSSTLHPFRKVSSGDLTTSSSANVKFPKFSQDMEVCASSSINTSLTSLSSPTASPSVSSTSSPQRKRGEKSTTTSFLDAQQRDKKKLLKPCLSNSSRRFVRRRLLPKRGGVKTRRAKT